MDPALPGYPRSEPICPICKDSLTDAVTITCRHNFCAPCLCLLWEDPLSPTRCPVCRAVSQQVDFKSTIFAKKQVAPTGESVSSELPGSAEQICKTHQAVKDLFCPNDKNLLCFLCCYAAGHATHRHYPVRQAAEHRRENILMQMKSIWKNKQKNQRNLNKETEVFKEWEGFVNHRMSMVRTEYPKVCQYLHEELQQHLESLVVEGKMIFQQLKKNIAKMVHTGKFLRRLYEELRELCCKTDVELLQDSGNIMIKAQLVQLSMPQPVEPQVTSWTITGMSERLNCFRVYITLDHKISKYDAPLFEELKRFQSSPDRQDMSATSAGSEYTPLWGAQTITSGKHYWEMNMGNYCNWIIGLCMESWVERNDMGLNSGGIFLLLCVEVDGHFHLFSTAPLVRQYIQRPQGWVGVFLDYECGAISFINVAKTSLICNYVSYSFTFPLRPFICYGPK